MWLLSVRRCIAENADDGILGLTVESKFFRMREVNHDTAKASGSVDDDVEYKYWAFISYSHRDEVWATWIHRALETYRLPKGVAGSEFQGEKIPPRLRPVFRDRDELAGGSDLGSKLRRHLRESRTLIVVCSPKSARSKWVNEEVRYFKSLGREHRVLCLVVGGEPYASAMAGQEDQECFPTAIRYQLDDVGEISSEPAEPLAADVRPRKDGKTSALLKLVAGILDIGYDRLKQREARRQKLRRIQWAAGSVCGLTLGFFGYLLLADYGVALPWRDKIQWELDKRNASVMRAVPKDEEVLATVEVLRGRVIQSMAQAKSNNGWLHQTLNTEQQAELPVDTCAHAQGVFALGRSREHGVWDDAMLMESVLQPFVPQEGKSISFFEEVFHPPVPSLKPIDSCGAFWLINMLADASSNPAPITAEKKPLVLTHLREVQQVLELYRVEGGGWRMFPGTQQTAPPNAYSTVLALLSLLECKKAGLPWLDSVEKRDELLKSSALWLHKQFHQGTKAAGWRGTGENRYEVFDGLTLQVYATLMRAWNEAGIAMPPHILQAMELHLIGCAFRPATFPVASGEFESEIVINGNKVLRKEAYRFLWYPWSLMAIEEWLKWQKSTPQSPGEVVRMRRARAHLIREIGDEMVSTVDNNWLFIAAETLYGLSPVSTER